MSDTTSETTEPVAILHFESGATCRVRPDLVEDGRYRFVLDVLVGLNMEEWRAQDFDAREEAGSWEMRHVGSARFPDAGQAVAAGRAEAEKRAHENDEVSLEWVQTALIARLGGVARLAGLDPSGWSFGQHAGLSWTLMDSKPGPGLHQLGIWQRWQEARFGIEGMIAALTEVHRQRDRVREAATD